MDIKQLLDEAVEELIKNDDGCNPNSPDSIENQLEKKRAEYREYLELKPFKLRIEQAIEVVQAELPAVLGEDRYSAFMSDLAEAGRILTENPELQGEKLGLSQNSFDCLFSVGETLLKKNEAERAAALFTLLTVLDPSWFRHWFYLGMALQDLKEYKEAVKAYEKANKITEESPLPHFFLTECFLSLDDPQNASVHFEKAKEIVATLPAHPDFERFISELEAHIQ